jgi:large subunit ribosomal protein L17
VRHRKAGRKLGRNPAQRKALFRQLAISMILHERITTTEAKAKSMRSVVEKLVTIAREDSGAHRRLVMAKIRSSPCDRQAVRDHRAALRLDGGRLHADREVGAAPGRLVPRWR